MASRSLRARVCARARRVDARGRRGGRVARAPTRARAGDGARETVRAADDDGAVEDAPSTTTTTGTLDALASVLRDRADDGDGDGAPTTARDAREASASRASARADAAAKARDANAAEASRRRATPEGVTDASWRRHWSPLSTVYNVPTVEPRVAYFIAFVHCAAFATDLALLRSGTSNGGDLFIRLALFDDAVVYGSQWMRTFTACLVDFGLLHFALVNVGLVTIGAEAEALLGTRPFLAVYALSAAMGGIGSMALDATTLHVTSSDGLMGVFGALLLYSALNVENEWNLRGFTVRLLYCGFFSVGFQYLASVPTEDGTHVVNSVGHLWGFLAGAAMGYAGLAPLFTSGKKFSKPPDDGRKNLEDVGAGPRKTFVMLGSASTALVALCVVVLLKRTLDVDPRDVF